MPLTLAWQKNTCKQLVINSLYKSLLIGLLCSKTHCFNVLLPISGVNKQYIPFIDDQQVIDTTDNDELAFGATDVRVVNVFGQYAFTGNYVTMVILRGLMIQSSPGT